MAALPLLVLVTAEDAGLAARLDTAAILTLAPLDAGGVAAVARLYAGARDDMEPPVERLAEASGGIPRRVHRLASDWARGEAASRVAATAGRAATERAELRAAEQDLAGNVVDLQAIPDPAEHEDDGIGAVVCPFKGLASFELEDADVFFGRERLVAEMVARLPGAQLMGIVGSSGSGKSSALRAGLLAALAVGVLPGSEGWTLALLRPGEHPMRAIEEVLPTPWGGPARRGRWTSSRSSLPRAGDEPERAAFVDALVTHARDPRGRTIVLVAMRADFYGRCGRLPGAVAAARRKPCAGRSDAPRRAAPRD